MTIRSRVFICFLASLLSQAIAPAWSAAADSAPAFAHEVSDLKPDPGVRWGRLANGIRYAVMSNATPKGRASLRFGVMAGSLDETDAQRGLAHFLEHLAFNGSAHFAPGTLVEYFQRLGLSFGSDANASTNYDRTTYQLELPDTNAATIDTAFTLFQDFAGGLLIAPEAIEKERGIILSELRDRDSPALRQSLAASAFIAPDARFVQRQPIGTAEIIRAAKREEILDFYDTWYRPENFVIVAVGDFDAKKVEAKLVETFSGVKPRGPARARADLGRVAALEKPQAMFYRQPEAAAVSVSITTMVPYAWKPDTFAQQLEEMPVNLAVAMINRRLGILSRREGTSIAGGQMQIADSFGFIRSFGLDVVCREENRWRECMGSGEQLVRSVLEQGFQADELAEVVADVRNRLRQSARGANDRNSSQLANGALFSIMDRRVFISPETELALWDKALSEFTAVQCQTEFRKIWLAGGSPRLFVSGNSEATDSNVMAAYIASVATPLEKATQKAAQSFSYAAAGKPGEISQRKHIDDLDITTVEFKNGVRLNLKPTAFEPGRILINVRAGGGLLSAPRDKPGLALLASSTFIQGGLTKHSIDDLRSLFAGKSLGYGFNVLTDAFSVGGATTTDDLLLELQVMQAFFTDPGYRPEALSEFRANLKQSYLQATHSLNGAQAIEIPRLMANGDQRFGLPDDPAVVLGRNYDELRQWLSPQLQQGAIEISLVGDFDLEQAIATIAQTFATLPQRQLRPAYTEERKVSFPKNPIVKEYKVDSSLERALVDIRWPATDQFDVRRARRLRMLANILSDRLRLTLREKLGQTYSPSAQDQLSDTFPRYGFIVATASTAPDQATKVAKTIKGVAADLARDGVTEDELKRAKEPILAHVKDSVRQNGYWLGVIGQMQESPQRLDWHREREADFRAISVAELNVLAQQYLDPQRASQFISVPAQSAAEKSSG